MDVGEANVNYASANIPFALGYTYHHGFSQPEGWTFDPEIFGPPFFPGTGFAGVKYLRSPRDSLGREVGLTTFGTFANFVQDPASSVQLYRFLKGAPDPAAGDPPCNAGDPKTTHICFINKSPPADIRFFQATGPLTLLPGRFESIVVAYIFAAPVKAGGCPESCDVTPGDPSILGDAARMAVGVNAIDSLTGYRGFTDVNGDGRVEQSEFDVVPGSLLGKALVAQTMFDNRFLLASSTPDAPDFFLVPGPNQVAVIWRPSPTEATGDLSYELVSQPSLPGGAANPMYDPNFRQFDVEGYRIYRGRVDTPSQLQLVAQFDYAGTIMVDWRGQVNPVPGCAPELGINTALAGDIGGCRVPFDSVIPGVAPAVSDTIPLVGPVVQVKLAPEGRQRLATGTALHIQLDTAISGAASGCLLAAGPDVEQCALRDTGVPFQFVDRGVRNDLRYFYAVTAFDINSIQSGPSSLESSRRTKPVTPVSAASNLERHGTVQVALLGRGLTLDTAAAVPILDPETGRFAGPFPPANAFAFGLADLVQTLLPESRSGSVSLTLDSLRLGSASERGPGEPGLPAVFYLTSAGAAAATRFQVPVVQDQTSRSAERLQLRRCRSAGGSRERPVRRRSRIPVAGPPRPRAPRHLLHELMGRRLSERCARIRGRRHHWLRVQRTTLVRWALAGTKRDQGRPAVLASAQLGVARSDERPEQRRVACRRGHDPDAARLRDGGGASIGSSKVSLAEPSEPRISTCGGARAARSTRSSTSPTTWRCRSTACGSEAPGEC